MGLVGPGEEPPMTPLTGGVSSDIWRVELPRGAVCVKRALPRLKVAALWEAPVERNGFEWEWMRTAAAIHPGAVPELIAHDPAGGMFVMAYLEPTSHPLWKEQLRKGEVDPDTAAAVGHRIGAIHAATAGDQALARRFASDGIFHTIRLEPYLIVTARVHRDRAAPLHALAATTAETKLALVHGDVSPKNILVGPEGPMFLDAECACYGDPAFDLAFCLNHLLLKCLWVPHVALGLLNCFDVLAEAYLAEVRWEPAIALEERAARLLPGLFLARIDGKSPVEYLTEEFQKDRVRRVARTLLAEQPRVLSEVRDAWLRELGL